MSLWDDTKRAFSGIVHPSFNTEEMSTSNALKFYYRASLIPFVISALLAAVIVYAVPTSLSNSIFSTFAGATVLRAMAMALVVFSIALEIFLVIPIGALIIAAIVQFFSKNLFKFWQGGYNKTLTAFVFGEFVSVFFMWLDLVPFVILALAIWALIVLTITLARQQNVSIGKAFLGWFVPMIIITVIAVILAIALTFLFGLGAFSSTKFLGTACISQSGFLCSNPIATPGSLAVTLGQATGAVWTSVAFCLVPNGTVMTSPTCPGVLGVTSNASLNSGQVTTVVFTDPTGKIIPTKVGATLIGQIWVVYNTSSSNNTISEIGTVISKIT